ncbi:type I polyketide synthase, partial [Streptomyces zhihengii]|uniref:type I polyketide synthase n=1 Tax=Streptomyces zhihengii TaxID=1818004 RepID=UPI0033A48CE7
LLGLPGPAAVDVDRPLRELGLNSLLTLRMAERLSTASGLSVSPKTLFDHPTCSTLADHLAACVNPPPSPPGGEDVPVGVGSVDGDGDGGDHDGRARTIPRWAAVPGSTGEEAPRPTATGYDGADEPIAVVGLACRFPGADGPGAFWRLLEAGEDAVRPVPARRWSPGARDGDIPSAAECAGLLDQDIEGFDAHFFGISAPEAAEMDPQQRLMLEVAWEALEDAGYDDSAVRRTKTGVFIGVTWNDFADRARTATVSPYTATGKALSMVANRVSYALGLRGPSLAVDTACSSSLLAVHLACQSLRTGESAVAIAGGVNLLLAEGTFRALEEFGGLSPDNRCKTFDASANGYARGEGCGAVVLKPLSAALADGDDVWCTVRGSAVNNDGQSNGLTAPNPVAQEEVLRDAYLRAGVSPGDALYVETHGTGTSLGDHIEATALGAVLGKGRPDDAPLLLGAVKTNIGHLEAAAGIAGLIKTALVLKHRTVPANLHCRTPHPDIDFTTLRLPRGGEPLPPHGPVLAGVSSFGWGGTNVHVVLESHGETASDPPCPASAGQGPVLMFAPPGGDWAGAGRRLYRTEPVFREAVDRCDREFARHTGRSLSRSLQRDPVPGPDTAFAVQVGTAALLEEAGVRPAAVVGAGTGEIVACVVAGVLEFADGVRLFHELVRTGRYTAQAVAEAAEHDVAGMLPAGGPVRVAARLGTRTTLLTGPAADLRTLVGAWAADGIRCALLGDADGAPLLLPRQDGAPPVAKARCTEGRFPVLSALTGTELVGAELGEGHFVRAAQASARLADAVSRLLAEGHRLIFDMGCHTAVTAAVRQTADDSGGGALVLPAAAWCGPDRTAPLGAPLGARPTPLPGPRAASLFTLTAKTSTALRELAARVAAAIDAEPVPVDVRDVAAAAARRSGQPHRLAVAVASSTVLVDVLRAYAVHGTAPGLAVSARPAHRRPKIAFLFPGLPNTAADPGAVRELLAEESVFRSCAEALDRDFTALTGRSVLTELTGSTVAGTGGPALSEPALFMLQSALTELLRSWGVEPEAFHGQGAGRFAALHASGALPPREAMRRAAGHRPSPGDAEAVHSTALGPVAALGMARTWCDESSAGTAAYRWPDDDTDAVLEIRLPPLLRLRSSPSGDAEDTALRDGPTPVSSARHHLLSVLARLFAIGVPIRPQEQAITRWKLPHYPWQRKLFPLPGSSEPVSPAHRAHARPSPPATDSPPDVEAPGSQAATGARRPGTQPQTVTPPGSGAIDRIVEILRLTVAEVVGIPHEAVGDDQPLRDLGMTSVMGVELCNRWEAVLGLRLPDTAVWNHPTVGALAALIERRLGDAPVSDACATGAPGPGRPATAPR